jgi:hypothetical protein
MVRRYISGRTTSTPTSETSHARDWLKFKNPVAPTVRREAEEDWGK